jgi:hypothetical protein
MDTISTNSFATVADFARACQQWEKANGKRWGQYVGTINGKAARIKTYGRSYPQILESDGVRYGGQGDLKPAEFVAELERAFG